MEEWTRIIDLQLFAEEPEGDDDLPEEGDLTPEEGDGEPEEGEQLGEEEAPPSKVFTQDEVDRIIDKRFARERSKYEEMFGGDPGQAAQELQYARQFFQITGMTPDQALNALASDQRYSHYFQQQPEPAHDPRVDILLEREEIRLIKDQWKEEFGAAPSEDELDNLRQAQKQYQKEYGAKLPLTEVYKLATRSTVRETVAKQTEKKILQGLEANRKGKTQPGAARSDVKSKPSSNASVKDLMTAIAEEIGL